MPIQSEMFSGETLKREGIELVSGHNPDWVNAAMTEIVRLVALKPEITADDLRPFIDRAGPPKHPNAIGAAFSGVAKSGLIRRVSFRKSDTPSNHSRYVTVWARTRAFDP